MVSLVWDRDPLWWGSVEGRAPCVRARCPVSKSVHPWVTTYHSHLRFPCPPLTRTSPTPLTPLGRTEKTSTQGVELPFTGNHDTYFFYLLFYVNTSLRFNVCKRNLYRYITSAIWTEYIQRDTLIQSQVDQ